MPVKQRGSSWQAAVSKGGRRFRRSFASKVEAEAWEASAKLALSRGELPDMGNADGVAPGMTLGDLLKYTMRNRWNSTGDAQPKNARLVVETIGKDVPVAKIDTRMIDNCVLEWSAEGNTGATVNRKLAALSTMLTEAQRLGVIASRPYLRRQKESEHRLRWFSHEEEAQIVGYFRHIGQHEIADACIVAVDTGLRAGTILALDERDVEINPAGVRSWLNIPGPKMKMKRAFRAPLTERARDIIAQRLSLGPKVFTFTYDSLKHYWASMRGGLGKPREVDPQFVFHVFRHTFCSRLVQAGVPIEVVQQLAAHKTLQMTMRYAKLAPKNLDNAITVLEGISRDDTGQPRKAAA